MVVYIIRVTYSCKGSLKETLQNLVSHFLGGGLGHELGIADFAFNVSNTAALKVALEADNEAVSFL